MLLEMKAKVEGIRALAVKLAVHHLDMDRSRQPRRLRQGRREASRTTKRSGGAPDVPLVKSYGSDQAFRVCETAIQTLRRRGLYQRLPGIEQYCRDAKIFSIYEGTNHIQAMDLVGRKLGQAGGANLQAFIGDVAKFVAANREHAVLGAAVKKLGAAQEALGGSAMKLLMWFQTGKVAMVPLSANRFCEMMSELTVGWLLLEGAVIAHEKRAKLGAGDADKAFYDGKVQAALFYARNMLPGVEDKARLMNEEDNSPIDIGDSSFATV